MLSARKWRIRIPLIATFLSTLIIFVAILLAMIEYGGTQFYITLLYEHPYGTTLERAMYVLFVLGDNLLLFFWGISLVTEYLYRRISFTRRHMIFFSGISVAIFSIGVLLATPGPYLAHFVIAAIISILFILHIGCRRLWLTILPIILLIATVATYYYPLWFSIFEILLSMFLLYPILFEAFWSTF